MGRIDPEPGPRATGWEELADGVYRRRHATLDLNLGLIVAGGEAVIVDTGASEAQGREVLDSVRTVTPAPVRTVINTHAHFDHCFGNATFADAVVWGPPRCRRWLTDHPDVQRRARDEHGLAEPVGDGSDTGGDTRIRPPSFLVSDETVLLVGGRQVRMHFLGRGHTDHDLVVEIPDAGVVFAGDLVEQGAPPSFADAWPTAWPATVRRLAKVAAEQTIVPGHGDLVDAAFADSQAEALDDVVHSIEKCRSTRASLTEGPYPETVMRAAGGRIQETASGIDHRVLPAG